MNNSLPASGRIACARCFSSCGTSIQFDQTKRSEGDWRITANPLAWGNVTPEVIVLGFSKGPTQAGALLSTHHNEIAYKGGRHNVGKILAHVGLIAADDPTNLSRAVSQAISDTQGRFHFGSLIRCTVERFESGSSEWKGSGGGMLDKFVATPFGREVAGNCANQFLAALPSATKLVVMFGLGTALNYVRESFKLYEQARKGSWNWINDVSYTDGKIIVVHVEHFASQGPLIDQWRGIDGHSRGRYGRMAQESVALAIEMPYSAGVTPTAISTAAKKMKEAKPMIAKTAAPAENTDTETILNAFRDANYMETKNVVYVAGFKSKAGQVVYIVKKTSKLNRINVMVHPDFSPEMLRKLDGVDSVSDGHVFHSNLTGYPKRFNGGETPTAHGWQLTFDTLQNLNKFLKAFSVQTL